MAREHGRIKTSIWADPAFADRTEDAQRVYLMLLSQPDVSYAGVVPFRPRRWAKFAKGSTIAKVRKSVTELESHGFVCVDEDTEELLIRTFIRHDGIMQQPNVARAMVKAYRNVLSQHLRAVILGELAREYDRAPTANGWSNVRVAAAQGGMLEELESIA